MKKVNVALQIIPIIQPENVYGIVDKAIEYIDKSGIKYRVTPFETVLEGDLDEIFEIIKGAQKACYDAGCAELITNIKIHSNVNNDITISDKMNKYEG